MQVCTTQVRTTEILVGQVQTRQVRSGQRRPRRLPFATWSFVTRAPGECRATSALLAVLGAVREYGGALLKPLGALRARSSAPSRSRSSSATRSCTRTVSSGYPGAPGRGPHWWRLSAPDSSLTAAPAQTFNLLCLRRTPPGPPGTPAGPVSASSWGLQAIADLRRRGWSYDRIVIETNLSKGRVAQLAREARARRL